MLTYRLAVAGVHLHHHLERLAGVPEHDRAGVARFRVLAALAGTGLAEVFTVDLLGPQ